MVVCILFGKNKDAAVLVAAHGVWLLEEVEAQLLGRSRFFLLVFLGEVFLEFEFCLPRFEVQAVSAVADFLYGVVAAAAVVGEVALHRLAYLVLVG